MYEFRYSPLGFAIPAHTLQSTVFEPIYSNDDERTVHYSVKIKRFVNDSLVNPIDENPKLAMEVAKFLTEELNLRSFINEAIVANVNNTIWHQKYLVEFINSFSDWETIGTDLLPWIDRLNNVRPINNGSHIKHSEFLPGELEDFDPVTSAASLGAMESLLFGVNVIIGDPLHNRRLD